MHVNCSLLKPKLIIPIQKIDDKVLRWECSEKVSKVGTECKLLCENDKILDKKAMS